MSFLSKTAPWGSPVVDSIPLPPFRSAEEYRRYIKMLQLHLALLDVGGPALPTLSLSASISLQHRSISEFSPWLTTHELQISLDTWFPAPWTPKALAQSLAQAAVPGTPTEKWGDWYWGQDPEFAAKRGTGGSWTIIRNERGSVTEETIVSDRDLVVLWLETNRNRFVLPWGVGYATEDQDAAELAPATLAVLEADIADARYPYRADWIAKRAALFAALPSTTEETPAPAQGD